LEIPNSAGNHASPFITENSEYIVAATRFSIPLDDQNGDVPINTYKQNFKGSVSFISVNPTSGEMNIAFQIRTPGVNFDLSRAGRANHMAGSFSVATILKKPTHYWNKMPLLRIKTLCWQ
jgi:nitrous-oxide reductase